MTVLLEALSDFLGRQQQPLAEVQYSGKFKLKFVRILVTHPRLILHSFFISILFSFKVKTNKLIVSLTKKFYCIILFDFDVVG